jgi:hypothetical protein
LVKVGHIGCLYEVVLGFMVLQRQTL